MKRAIIIFLFVVCLVSVFFVGFKFGIMHTVKDCKIETDSSYYLLEIDGQVYEYFK